MQRSCWLEVQEVQEVQGSGTAVQKVQERFALVQKFRSNP